MNDPFTEKVTEQAAEQVIEKAKEKNQSINSDIDFDDNCDFPAAHSMDTTWFAVDKDGFVALMDSAEPGAVPMAYTGDQGDGSEFVEKIAARIGKKLQGGDIEEFAHSLGLFSYICDYDYPQGTDVDDESEEFMDATPPYKRVGMPTEPLHVSKLPLDLQRELDGLAFKNSSFQTSEWLQPGLEMPCQFWADENAPVNAVDSEGKLVAVPQEMRPRWSERNQILQQTRTPEEKPWWKKILGID